MASSNQAFDRYCAEIRSYPRLTLEEEKALGEAVKAGRDPAASEEQKAASLQARDKLVNSNLALVLNVVKQELPIELRGSDLNMDAIGEGNNGLLKAAEMFDPDKNVHFSTYADAWIRSYVKKAIASFPTIKIPQETRQDLYRISKAAQDMLSQSGSDPSDKEIADKLGMKEEKVSQLRALGNAATIVSLDDAVGDEEKENFGDRYIGDNDDEAQAAEEETNSAIAEGIATLTSLEADVLSRYLGLGGKEEESLSSIGKSYGFSRERARQIKERANAKLKAFLEEKGING